MNKKKKVLIKKIHFLFLISCHYFFLNLYFNYLHLFLNKINKKGFLKQKIIIRTIKDNFK